MANGMQCNNCTALITSKPILHLCPNPNNFCLQSELYSWLYGRRSCAKDKEKSNKFHHGYVCCFVKRDPSATIFRNWLFLRPMTHLRQWLFFE